MGCRGREERRFAKYAATDFHRYREGRMFVRCRVGESFANMGGTAEATGFCPRKNTRRSFCADRGFFYALSAE